MAIVLLVDAKPSPEDEVLLTFRVQAALAPQLQPHHWPAHWALVQTPAPPSIQAFRKFGPGAALLFCWETKHHHHRTTTRSPALAQKSTRADHSQLNHLRINGSRKTNLQNASDVQRRPGLGQAHLHPQEGPRGQGHQVGAPSALLPRRQVEQAPQPTAQEIRPPSSGSLNTYLGIRRSLAKESSAGDLTRHSADARARAGE